MRIDVHRLHRVNGPLIQIHEDFFHIMLRTFVFFLRIVENLCNDKQCSRGLSMINHEYIPTTLLIKAATCIIQALYYTRLVSEWREGLRVKKNRKNTM